MNYACPRQSDLDETRDLNLAFLRMLRGRDLGDDYFAGLNADLRIKLRSLSSAQARRLARVPFLLLSFREHEAELWDHAPADGLADGPTPSPVDGVRGRLLAAGLGFSWQLARRNPYALRLLTGANLHWCERLAEQPFLAVMRRVSHCTDLPRLRAASDEGVWQKLLTDGVSRVDSLRLAAQLSSLQMRLTRPPTEAARWAAAACRTRVPMLTLSRPNEP